MDAYHFPADRGTNLRGMRGRTSTAEISARAPFAKESIEGTVARFHLDFFCSRVLVAFKYILRTMAAETIEKAGRVNLKYIPGDQMYVRYFWRPKVC